MDNLRILLAILFIYFLRRSIKDQDPKPKWDQYLLLGFVLPVFFIIVQYSIHKSIGFVNWLTDFLLIGLIYINLTEKDFEKVKGIAYGVVPLVLVFIFSDFLHLFSSKLYHSWDDLISISKIFAFVWFVAMWIVNNRQSKALEAEKQKTIEKEKQNKITEALKADLEVQVAERTAEITQQKNALEEALNTLKATQSQLIQSEKMASLGELTAGIAHEIQNPLNFMNNFSDLNNELIDEIKEELRLGNLTEALYIAENIAENEQKINFHGKRADAIVKGMLLHSRVSNGHKEPTNLNSLADEYLRLAYHGLRAKDKSFNATLVTQFDPELGLIDLIPQDMGRAILNLITNAFYTITEKKSQHPEGYEPTVTVSTRKFIDRVEIGVKDNGNGIPQEILDKIFQPFFTTKPTGQGTGLGLSLTYDIVKAQGGELTVQSQEGQGSEFIIKIPVNQPTI